MSTDLSDKSCRIRPTAKPSVAVVGASTDPEKFSYKAVQGYVESGFEVYPVNPNATEVAGRKCYPSITDLPVGTLDRVVLYVPGIVGMKVLDELAHVAVGEIWASPGADDPAVLAKARKMGMPIYQVCSLDFLGVKR